MDIDTDIDARTRRHTFPFPALKSRGDRRGEHSLAVVSLVADAGALGAAAQRPRQTARLALKDVLPNTAPLSTPVTTPSVSGA